MLSDKVDVLARQTERDKTNLVGHQLTETQKLNATKRASKRPWRIEKGGRPTARSLKEAGKATTRIDGRHPQVHRGGDRRAEGRRQSVAPGTAPGKLEFTLTPEAKELNADFEKNKGKLPWPVEKGIITSGFGKQAHPVLRGIMIENNGLDIT